MYNNPGAKLKKVVEIIVQLYMLLSIVAGIVIWILLANTIEDIGGVVGFMAALIVVPVGCVTAWLGGLILATFADMGDHLHAIRSKITPETGKTESEMSGGTKPNISMPYVKMAGKNIEDYPHNPDFEWVCSSCGTVNKLGVKYCEQCGCGVALK